MQYRYIKNGAKFSALALLAAGFFALDSTSMSNAATNPISISHCFVTVPKPLSKVASGTQIGYINHSTKTATKVTFVVGYRNAESTFLRKVTDVGSFTPGTPIDHHFSLYNDVTYAGKQTRSCQAVKVVWSDGTAWVAP